MEKHELVGRWRVLSWVQHYDDGRDVHPMGHDIDGFLHYDHERMTALISRRNRTPFADNAQWAASEYEKAAAYDGFLSYSGRYVLEADQLTHFVDMSLFPNWCGGAQK